MIKSEDTFLVGYVLFDKKAGIAEVDVVEAAGRLIQEKEARGEFLRPAGVTISFAGYIREPAPCEQDAQIARAAVLVHHLPRSVLPVPRVSR